MGRRRLGLVLPIALVAVASCAGMPNRDPLIVSVAAIEPLPGEGMELNLAIRLRVQNPNDVPVAYSGAALWLDLNGRRLASGVTDSVGTVPRYGEVVMTMPVTISAFDMARQVFAFVSDEHPNEVRYRVRGKLEGGLFGTRRFRDEGMFELGAPAGSAAPLP
jgi:LEA14-like dessication related protein